MIFKNQQYMPSPLSADVNLIFRARILWRDLAMWIRNYLVSTYAGFGNQEAVGQRLYKLPLDYGNLLRIFYGDQATEQYITLLSNYIVILESLFTAQLNNDINAINEYTRQSIENVNARAAFFASINPFWLESDWRNLLYSFNDLIIEMSTAMLSKDYIRDIEIFDRLIALTSIIGDYFSEGLIDHLNYRSQQQQTIP